MAENKYPEPKTPEDFRWAILKIAVWAARKIVHHADRLEALQAAMGKPDEATKKTS